MKTIKKIAQVPLAFLGFCAALLVIGLVLIAYFTVMQWFVYHIEYFILPAVVVGLIWLAARKG